MLDQQRDAIAQWFESWAKGDTTTSKIVQKFGKLSYGEKVAGLELAAARSNFDEVTKKRAQNEIVGEQPKTAKGPSHLAIETARATNLESKYAAGAQVLLDAIAKEIDAKTIRWIPERSCSSYAGHYVAGQLPSEFKVEALSSPKLGLRLKARSSWQDTYGLEVLPGLEFGTPGIVQIFVPRPDSERKYYDFSTKFWAEDDDDDEHLFAFLGCDPWGTPVTVRGWNHIAIIGTSRSGKSFELINLVAGLSLRGPKKAKFVLIDKMNRSFGQFDTERDSFYGEKLHFANLYRPALCGDKVTKESLEELFEDLLKEHSRRCKLMGTLQKISTYNQLNPQAPLPHIFITISEWQDLCSEFGPDWMLSLIDKFKLTGAAQGMHLILESQRCVSGGAEKAWTSGLLSAADLKVMFRCASADGKLLGYGGDSSQLAGYGDGRVLFGGETNAIQAPNMGKDGGFKVLQQLDAWIRDQPEFQGYCHEYVLPQPPLPSVSPTADQVVPIQAQTISGQGQKGFAQIPSPWSDPVGAISSAVRRNAQGA
jgi:hypothetical protein